MSEKKCIFPKFNKKKIRPFTSMSEKKCIFPNCKVSVEKATNKNCEFHRCKTEKKVCQNSTLIEDDLCDGCSDSKEKCKFENCFKIRLNKYCQKHTCNLTGCVRSKYKSDPWCKFHVCHKKHCSNLCTSLGKRFCSNHKKHSTK